MSFDIIKIYFSFVCYPVCIGTCNLFRGILSELYEPGLNFKLLDIVHPKIYLSIYLSVDPYR